MDQVEVYLVKAFSLCEQGGNLAGVVLHADGLTDTQKQSIAKQVGVSETAFISKSDKADFQLSFFTPSIEVDFCGHATLGAFWLLHHLGHIFVGSYQQETKAGVLGVEVLSEGSIIMNQSLPVWFSEFSADDIAPMLGIQPDLITQLGLPIQAISTGLVDVMVPVPFGMLDDLAVDSDAISTFCKQHEFVGFHVFELLPLESEFTANCRNFAPAVDIPEESATGSSSGALACYLNRHFGYEKMVFQQGRAMKMTSQITAELRLQNGEVTEVKVGGEGALVKKVFIEV